MWTDGPGCAGGSSDPRATVIIPTFNAADTLGEQLDALARQDAPFEFEVLVCDNGSTDATAELLMTASTSMPHLRRIEAFERRGAAAARNVGATAARSHVLLFCDADDVVDASWVRIMTARVIEHGFVAGLMEHALLNPTSQWTGGWVEPTYREGFMPWLAAAGSGNMGVNADVFASVGGFDETRPSGEDADLSWRLQLAGHPVHSAWDAVVHVRKRTGLRATLRQGFAKGIAVHQLKHDYADVARALALRDHSTTPSVGSEEVRGAEPDVRRLRVPWGRLARIPARVIRIIRRPSQALRECGELSSWLGSHFGRIDEARAPIDVSTTRVH